MAMRRARLGAVLRPCIGLVFLLVLARVVVVCTKATSSQESSTCSAGTTELQGSRQGCAKGDEELCHDISRVCGVVALFNPAGYASRMENYRKFRARSKAQGLWLLVVHVDMNKAETLIEIDADAVIHLVADDRHVMWQKERLLNIGLAHLPVGECSTVVWPDADMLFVNENWVQETHDMIQSGAQVVQPFQYALRLSRGVDWLDPSSKRVSLSKDEGVRTPGFAFSVQRGADRNEETRKAVLDSQQKHGYTGFAWAASRAALEDMGGLFDVAIVGGGDALMAHAFANHVAGESWEPYYYARRLSDRWSPLAKSFHVWAERAAYATQGKLGWVSGTALHLWHGSKEGRQYGSRFDILHKGTSSFDPDVHLERSECAVVNSTVEVILEKCFLWQWRDGNSDAARMRRDVRRMFQLREEDG